MASSAVMPSKSGMAMSMGRPPGLAPSRGGAEMATVLGGADPDPAPKRAVHGLDAAEAARGGHLGHAQVGGLEETARALDPLRLHVGGGRQADLPAEGAREIARAHAGGAREGGHREVLAQVIGDPTGDRAARVARPPGTGAAR